MAKQSVQKLLELNAEDMERLSNQELKHYVQILNSAANKRLTRMEKAGIQYASAAYRTLESVEGKAKRFTSVVKADSEKEYRGELLSRFKDVRRFLNPSLKTNTIAGVRSTIENVKEAYRKLSEDVRNVYKKTYVDRSGVKRKAGTLKKTVINQFWKEYHSLMEERRKKGLIAPQRGGTNMDDVSTFYSEYYSKGRTSLMDYQKGAEKEYEQQQRNRISSTAERIDKQTEEYENPPWRKANSSVSVGSAKSNGIDGIKQTKSKGIGKSSKTEEKLNYHKIRFKKVKIF